VVDYILKSHEVANKIRYKNDYIVLKMDIETSEYYVLPHLIETGALEYINEIYVEFHLRYAQHLKDLHNNIIHHLKQSSLYFKEWH